ncbi:MAG TPA: dienelactone hydrolase family protein [Candidatus Angelobacter sp.]
MGTEIKLTAADGHQLNAYLAESAKPSASLVVIQEIFGVNSHIRRVADDYASEGIRVIAPGLFDRVQPNLEFGYGPEDMARGLEVRGKIGQDSMMKDVAAAIAYADHASHGGKTGVLGYCLGGTLAWLSATWLNVAAAVGYYGGRTAEHAKENPRCPVMLHFGAKDQHISLSEIDKIRRAHPDIPIFIYDAGHGFNCEERKDYEPKSASLARERTLEFLRKYL